MKFEQIGLGAVVALSVGMVSAQLNSDFETPLNEFGQPDLSGVWNFASDTPMQRPDRWGTQEFLTPEQLHEELARANCCGVGVYIYMYMNTSTYIYIYVYICIHVYIYILSLSQANVTA